MFQTSGRDAVRVFSARACAAPLKDAIEVFTRQTGIPVEVSVCSRHCARPVAEEAAAAGGDHDFLDEISEAGIHDLAIGGAEYLLDDGEVRGIVAKGQRLVAERIREVARRAGVPIVEDRPLARALFPRPLGSEVPPHLYRAVARILVLVARARILAGARAAGARPTTGAGTGPTTVATTGGPRPQGGRTP